MRCSGLLSFGLIFISCSLALAQGRRADYERAAKLPALTRGKVLNARLQPHWLAGNDRFWYRRDLGEGRCEFILVDAVAGTRAPAFDHARLAQALAKATGKPVAADKLPFDALEFPEGGRVVRLFGGGKGWECDLQSYALTAHAASATAGSLPGGGDPRPSRRTGPDSQITFVNRSDGVVDVFWVDTEGQRHQYGSLKPGERRDQHTFGGHVWLLADRAGKVLGVFEAEDDPATAIVTGERPPVTNPEPPAAGESHPGPEGPAGPEEKWSAFIRDSNIWVRTPAGEVALTKDGSPEDAYRDLYPSPDHRHLAALKTKPAQEHKVTLIESSPADQVQPKVRTIDYLKPGDRIATTTVHLFDMEARKEIPVSQALCPTPWEIWEVRWDSDSSRFTFFYNQRGHQVLRIIAVDAETGRTQAIIDEESKTFIDYARKHVHRYLDATHEILWSSERDGWNHLYLYDARTGKVKNQITRGEWVVRWVDRVDEQKRQIWFQAGGIVPGQDPYYIQYCRVNFDGTGLTMLTEGDGTHSIAYSPDRRFLIDTWSRVDMPPVHELRRVEDGKLICTLERADAKELLATGWKTPERFVAKGRDGKTDIYGIIIRPTNFRKDGHYPVIENIYAGPQASYVPKAWSNYYGMQEIAELGFIVVQIDGMGTSDRSKAFHDVCWRNLADAGFPDRILWMQAAARKYPYMDLSRVGIYGGSAGGQNALGALLFHPEFYKVAVADSGCHDNRMDKIWWNELWMGWPIGPWYAEQSNVTNAHKLQGKLLLVVGELDTNVDPSSTMQVVNALIKADKDFDLLVVPGGGHGVAETPYGRRRRQDFFVRNLLGVEPRGK